MNKTANKRGFRNFCSLTRIKIAHHVHNMPDKNLIKMHFFFFFLGGGARFARAPFPKKTLGHHAEAPRAPKMSHRGKI
jgi:hypothetical protein